ncbi:uncharacterized protein BKA78DRAFT_303379 [Phyllosticta capitalensis]|uniref:uncharacterized protein n=1 Tax=Phyllosticta capitalensis TaxID=121624 RepID=UPI0031318BC6
MRWRLPHTRIDHRRMFPLLFGLLLLLSESLLHEVLYCYDGIPVVASLPSILFSCLGVFASKLCHGLWDSAVEGRMDCGK